MKGPALIIALVVCVSVVAVAAYTQANAPGANVRVAKNSAIPAVIWITNFDLKDQSRIARSDCVLGWRDNIMCEGE